MEAEKTSIKTTMPQLEPSSMVAVEMVFNNDDILCEILLLLNLPTLLRAILVSKRWYRVASGPAFLSRFRHLHPLHLLGFYMESWPSPRFVPLPQHDQKLATFVTRRGPLESGEKSVDILDFRNGCLLLKFFHSRQVELAFYSPLHPKRGSITLLPSKPNVNGDLGLGRVCLEMSLLPQDGGDGMSCTEIKVIYNGDNRRRVWIQVSDLEAGVWCKVRSSKAIELPENMIPYPKRKVAIPQDFISQFGKIYVLCMKGHILGINLSSMSLFCIKLPDGVEYYGEGMMGLSRANGTGIYLVHQYRFQIYVWHYSTVACNTSRNWNLVDTISLRQAFGDLADPIWYIDGFSDHLVAVGDNADFVLMKIDHKFFYMDICSRKIKKVYELPRRDGYMLPVYPLMMPWPPSFPALRYGDDCDK